MIIAMISLLVGSDHVNTIIIIDVLLYCTPVNILFHGLAQQQISAN